MKFCFIIQDLIGQGAQYATAAVARSLNSLGHQVEILVSPVHDDKVKSLGQQAFQLDPRIQIRKLPYRKARQNIWALRRYLKYTDADAVLSTSGPYHIAHRLARIGLKTRCLNVLMNHGIVGLDESTMTETPTPKRFSLRWLYNRLFLLGFERVFCVNSFTRNSIQRLCPSYDVGNIHVVYNPCIDDVFFVKRQTKPTHPWLVDKCGMKTFVTAGSFSDSKHQIGLLRAIEQVVKDGHKVRFVIFGAGKLGQQYQDFVDKHNLGEFVSLPGYTNNFPAELQGADCFVLPSRWESFGIVVVEALASGVPVISTDSIGPAEILQNGRWGRMVPVDDDKALAHAIIEELKCPQEKPTFASWEHFTAEASARLFVKGIERGDGR